MNVKINIECTPEEARRFLGLPDLSAVHAAYIAQMADAVATGASSDITDAMLKSWGPMNEAATKFFQQMAGGVKS